MSRSLCILSTLICMLAFQNCSKANFGGSQTAVANNAAPVSTGGTSSGVGTTTTSSSSSCPNILCTINFADISEIKFNATLNTQVIGSYGLNLDTLLNDSNDTFVAKVDATGPISLITLASCTANGTNVDFTSLEQNLEAMTFSTTESSSSSLPDFGSAQLSFVLKDGTTRTFTVDTQTTSVSVGGVSEISAVGLVGQLKNMALTNSCSSSLPLF